MVYAPEVVARDDGRFATRFFSTACAAHGESLTDDRSARTGTVAQCHTRFSFYEALCTTNGRSMAPGADLLLA